MAEKTRTVEYDGYKITVDMDLFDDVKFFELADGVQERQSNLIDIMRLILKDKFSDLEAYFVKKDGRLKMSTISAFVDKLLSIDPKE